MEGYTALLNDDPEFQNTLLSRMTYVPTLFSRCSFPLTRNMVYSCRSANYLNPLGTDKLSQAKSSSRLFTDFFEKKPQYLLHCEAWEHPVTRHRIMMGTLYLFSQGVPVTVGTI